MRLARPPGWTRKAEKTGKPAQAVELLNPQQGVQGIGSHPDSNGWPGTVVEVEPIEGVRFKGKGL